MTFLDGLHTAVSRMLPRIPAGLSRGLHGAPGACLFLVSALLCTGTSHAADVQDIRLWRAPDYTRIVFDLDQQARYSLFTLENPYRIVVDLSASRVSASLSGFDFKNSPVTGIRSAPRNGDDVRVVIDLSNQVNPSSFILAANGELKDRLVVDLYDVGRAPALAETLPATPVNTQRDIIVAIDAGHGGEDPGALGYDRKIREKDIALAIARAIYQRLQSAPGYQPVLIRDGDYSVQLQRRPQIARQNRADIFLSIHADSFSTARAEGVTIYALSERIAEDENSRRVAEKENSADLLGGVAGDTSLRNIEDDLARTLLDLSMAWSIEQSTAAGSYILGSLRSVATLRRDKTQQGNLWVLRSPDIPSVLIETGYLSNPDEARKLNTSAYQRRLADGIVQGVMRYFHEHPPEDTLIAWQKEQGIEPQYDTLVSSSYTVKRGDSLSEIAQRHGLSTRELREANQLKGDVIRIGQKLTIPGSGISFAPEPVEHKIVRGETLSGIAERYRVSLSSLRAANNLRNDVIMVGQVLKIPAP
ncbi:MAG: N-acetylmuramoyl-L-alanine amidase [Pseudomonadales bacterium]|nr:N-acetylmuramoyl-L-alanine amidase [Pseudomonadales bacterium]MCP5330421.1 N-acetylmuramoyl-L-alanine amidase [Pseudomonadales bacterium]MCP5343966.1 N-acetylmuramoyl-L-alanine amidase [Pseudomonadales bacterium]